MGMEIQPQWEEFIIAIFKMNRRQGKATNKELSQWLSVSPSLVTELIKKMQTEGILAPGKNIIALNDFLHRPAACPHGGAIFANRAEELAGLVPLSESTPGVTYTMRRIPDNTALLEYVEHIGLALGQTFTVKGFESFDHTAIIDLAGTEVRVSPKACVDIYLEAETAEE